ncbi:MAG: carboxypeptidase regulatory-like domain-containing protein [Phycisphaerae bacterium]|nr:carboxypeptidase regulatory-like domain-containing protein [Saprospiraceae bacterium]
MKVTLFLSSLWLFIASLFSPATTTILTGNVTDGKEALIGATVRAMHGKDLVRGTTTDYNGDYRLELEPGTYDLEFAYTGFQTQRISGVRVLANQITKQNMTMITSSTLEEVVIMAYKTALVEEDKTSGGSTLTSDEIKKLPTRPTSALGPAPAGKSPRVTDTRSKSERSVGSEGAKMKTAAKSGEPMASKPAPTERKLDAFREARDAPPKPVALDGMVKEVEPAYEAEAYEEKDLRSDDEDIATGTPAQPAPRAGLLTAGEWNDLHNWNRHWVDLLTDGEIDSYQKMYGFYPRQRYTVMLTNENDFPIADAVVQLKSSDGKILWEARTDNTGKAELWAALFNPEKETARLRAEIWVNGQKHELTALKPAADGFNNLKINAECNAPKNVDIVWAVDATGSMGDEIEYLKTELLDVIGRAKSRNPELAYRMGTVFYRDKGDEYITKSSGLSPDIANTVDFIQKQFAGGGGDYPEAVHSALEEAIFSQKWSENAVARICFLVLDASPHQEPEVIASIQKSIREAARLGIRIVPIAASGIQKDTEFLMKFFGLATNGSYVFLTDHSGIGGKHLEPTTDEYKVEPLNNLLVRLITEYTSIQTCEGKSEIRFENDPQQQPGPMMQALYYPNPAVNQFTLELPFEVQSVTIYDSEGKAVRKVEKPVAGQNVILLNDLAAGFYTIRILNNGLMQSGKLMVVRS